MHSLYMDLEYGISGDMFLASLADLGVDYTPLQEIFNDLGLNIIVEIVPESRNGFLGSKATIKWTGQQPLRNLKDLLKLVNTLDISNKVKGRCQEAFTRLARAEAVVHGQSMDEVHFHELGGLDTLVDITGAFWGLDQLGVKQVTASPVPWFRGKVETAHGELSLPAPATAVLLRNKKIRPSDHGYEIITPTGALILDQVVDQFCSGFEGVLLGSGTGFGKERQSLNCLRTFLYDYEAEPGEFTRDHIWVLTTNVDHLTGEEMGAFMEQVMHAGALDVILLPGIMKKSRPGSQIQVMCRDNELNRVQDALFQQTLTLGIRISRAQRVLLPRRESRTKLGRMHVRAKEIMFRDQAYIRPEMSSLLELADREGKSTVQIRLARNPD